MQALAPGEETQGDQHIVGPELLLSGRSRQRSRQFSQPAIIELPRLEQEDEEDPVQPSEKKLFSDLEEIAELPPNDTLAVGQCLGHDIVQPAGDNSVEK